MVDGYRDLAEHIFYDVVCKDISVGEVLRDNDEYVVIHCPKCDDLVTCVLKKHPDRCNCTICGNLWGIEIQEGKAIHTTATDCQIASLIHKERERDND